MITKKKWDAYTRVISNFMDTEAGLAPITWKRFIDVPSLFGEDGQATYQDIELKVLVADNSYRTWPINKPSPSGITDNQSLCIYVSKSYLADNDLLNVAGRFTFNPDKDRFVIEGLQYMAGGDTQVSQAGDKSILFMIILKRLENDNR